jgi:hypothetical protein
VSEFGAANDSFVLLPCFNGILANGQHKAHVSETKVFASALLVV